MNYNPIAVGRPVQPPRVPRSQRRHTQPSREDRGGPRLPEHQQTPRSMDQGTPEVHPTLRNGGYPRPEKEPILNSFSKIDLNSWCGRRDLNPGYRLGRPVSWTRLDYGRSRYTELFLWGIWVKVFRNSLSEGSLTLLWVCTGRRPRRGLCRTVPSVRPQLS